MLKHIKVTPLAAESLGTRSMCTYVETRDTRILLDAGVSLCPNRFGLPPHPIEFEAIIDSRKRIAEAARKAEIITISHYHNDHHTPSFEDWLCNWTQRDETARQIYEDKVVFVKNPRDRINHSQRQRGWMFQQTSGKYTREICVADNKSFKLGSTSIRFSEAVFHGPENSELGWIIMATIECQDERFLFAPDIQGPMVGRTLEIIINEKPQLAMIGGPPSYLTGFKVDENQIEIGIRNLGSIAREVPHLILEHHILRDEKWREKTDSVFYSAYQSGNTIQTAAEFLRRKNTLLEIQRKRLFSENPPSKEFEKWMRSGEEARRYTMPPI